MEAAIAAFLAHPTVGGAFALLLGLAFYGTVRLTASATRGVTALEGIRTDIATARGEDKVHRETLAARVSAVEVRIDAAKVETIKAVDATGARVVDELRDRRLSDIAAALDDEPELPRKRSATGTGRALAR